jgi:(1->4)-alpha-D-glucan 1-alpha-D-glucosylmutase
MVDPDNRRLPDWQQHYELLSEVTAADPALLSANWQDGRAKIFVASKILRCRQEHPDLFERGDYVPLYAENGNGGHDHLCAFLRQHEDAAIAVAVPRLLYRLHAGGEVAQWGSTRLPLPKAGSWRDVLTGRAYDGSAQIAASDLFRAFPISVLISQSIQSSK